MFNSKTFILDSLYELSEKDKSKWLSFAEILNNVEFREDEVSEVLDILYSDGIIQSRLTITEQGQLEVCYKLK